MDLATSLPSRSSDYGRNVLTEQGAACRRLTFLRHSCGARAGLTLLQLSAAPGQSRSEPSTVLRYAIAVLSVAIALVAALLVVTFLQTEPFVSLFLCAIMFAAWFGGIGPGLFATGLSLFVFYYYLVPPINLFAVKYNSFGVELKDLPRLILFSIAALFVNLLSAAQRDTAGSLIPFP
jgi:K+-sensing histidine kinase KdpD